MISNTYEEYIERLDMVMTRLKECNLKLAPEKCSILRKEVNYLGHVVSEDGVSTDPSKIVKIKEGPVPTNADDFRYFVAFAGYCRKFVKNFSTLVITLNEKLPPTSHKKGLKRPPKTEWNWTDKDQEVFQKVKEVLSTPPILAYPDISRPFGQEGRMGMQTA